MKSNTKEQDIIYCNRSGGAAYLTDHVTPAATPKITTYMMSDSI